jgi:hypothetical protein
MYKSILLAMVSVAALCMTAETYGDTLPTKDVSGFSYMYSMDVDPLTQDLDSDSNADWMAYHGGGLSYSDGIMTVGASNLACLGAGPFGGGGANEIFMTKIGEGSYTAEFSAKVVSNMFGESGPFSKQVEWGANQASTHDRQTFRVTTSNTSLDGAGTLLAADNTDVFHIFRLAYDRPSNTTYVWRDGAFLVSVVTKELGGGSGGVCFGQFEGGAGGVAQVGYLAFTPGAYAPVPEPSALALVLAGVFSLVAYAWRKRR